MDHTIQPMKKTSNNFLSAFGQIIVLIAFIAAGWFLRGLVAGGPPAGGMPGMPGGADGPTSVETIIVEEGPSLAPQEYIGRVEAIQSVAITAQVSGYIETVHFVEGALIQEGDLLFTIEQEPFNARLAQVEASLTQAKADLTGAKADVVATKASLESARADLDRTEKYLKRLQSADKRSIVEANLDDAISDEKQARARVQELEARFEQAKASIQQTEALIQKTQADLKLAQIDLGYTEIRSPITGKIGKAVLTKGNYVSPSSGPLANVIQLDPIRVVFSMTDREYVSLLQEKQGSIGEFIEVQLRLPNGEPYSVTGRHDFDNNQMDPNTGTIQLHVRFDNPDGHLVPQSFITVILNNTKADKVPIVPQEAILVEGNGDYVFVVGKDNAVEKRKIVLGAKIDDYQCVSSGLNVGEQVVTQGLQKIQPGQKVALASAQAKGDA